jgi:hypothetical protein
MNKLIKALLLGMAAGILDVIPMIFQNLSWQTNLSAFLHWLGLSVIITYARLPISGWLSGLLIAMLTGIPIAVLVAESSTSAVIPILLSSAILGSLIGFMIEKTITDQPNG